MTFDTSLVDLKPDASFSTTESDPSDFGVSKTAHNVPLNQQSPLAETQSQDTPQPSQSEQSTSPSSKLASTAGEEKDRGQAKVRYIPTQEAYDQWASVYDSDGNMLQSIDDLEVPNMLTDFFTWISYSGHGPDISLLDLGCGTGRSMAKLIDRNPLFNQVSLFGLDFSQGMLDVAAQKLGPLAGANEGIVSLKLECCDCFPTVDNPSASPMPAVLNLSLVTGVISTLVLEHVPLGPYFATLSSLLIPNGMALVTNMHADMGRVSQAGFVDAQGVKIRGSSFAFTVQETVDEAKKAGFAVIRLKERMMIAEDIESGKVGERGRKWVGTNVWYGLLLQKTSSDSVGCGC